MTPHGATAWKASAIALGLSIAATLLPAGTPVGLATARDGDSHPADALDLDALGLGLYSHLGRRGDENLLISPFSTATALAMVLSGASGENARLMACQLHFPAEPERRDRAFARLLDATVMRDGARGVTLDSANGLWYQQGLELRDDYRARVRSLYKATASPVDFRKDPEASRSAVNSWVNRETRHKISELLTPGSVSPETRLILANAVYFSAPWEERFASGDTRPASFRCASGVVVDVPMMHRSGLYRYAVIRGVEVLELPFEGGRFVFVLLLPKKPDGLPDLERRVADNGLGPWLSRLPNERELVDVYLPRFELNVRVRLDEALRSHGLGPLFDGRVDLSGIAPGTPPMSGALTQVRLRVDERGSEATAASATVLDRSVPPAVRADHPFMFLIRDRQTQVTFFLGRLANPR